ncbi:hypothetical protein TrRE_jg4776 [Triparma retinervis]|uniref:Uncharacterized protein n=1 Tax=Triparma retinervis TaxID=2557542 RepID=A0A9W7G482_9STRA|nr:hypothetical protein TrRE_jg4776 [Triparma retinervis]
MLHTSIPPDLHGVSDALSLSPKNSKSPLGSRLAQVDRVLAARSSLARLASASSSAGEPPRSGRVVTVVGKRGEILEGHRIVDEAMAAKYPGATWEVKEANFHDREELKKRLGDLSAERRRMLAVRRDLVGRERDSREKVKRLKDKKRMLANARDMKDFKVDLGGGEEGRDGWLRVDEPPKNDQVSRQVRTLEVRLLNKEMVKGMAPLESLALEASSSAIAAERRLASLKSKLSSFPVKAVQGIEEVRRRAIGLIEEKGELEERRERLKRNFNGKLSKARSQVSRMRDVVQDSSEELAGLREDLRYWQQRLKLERVKVEPVRAAVERLKEELEATANAEGIGGGWMGAVGRAAFLIGCNVDVVTGGRLEGRGGGEALRFEDVVDKIRGSRVVGVLREHTWPSIKTGVDEIREVCDEEGVWYNEERFEESRFGEGDWGKILRKLREREEEKEEEK